MSIKIPGNFNYLQISLHCNTYYNSQMDTYSCSTEVLVSGVGCQVDGI
jgi:hypothetical protein